MNLYMFTCFNDKEVLSIGIISQDGRRFYRMVDWQSVRIDMFVAMKVIPNLGEGRKISKDEMIADLLAYLSMFKTPLVFHVTSFIHIKNLNRLLLGRNVEFTHVISPVDVTSTSARPYNALEDAVALATHLNTEPVSNDEPIESVAEFDDQEYVSDTYRMKREAAYGGFWVVRRRNGDYVDNGRYRYDLAELYGFDMTAHD